MKVIFFTGAGISAESGISTFRDADGLWENNKISEICNINTWKKNKEKVFKFYSDRRKQLKDVEPNNIHKTIAELQNKYGEDKIKVITQNIDDLLERAGCKKVLHVHGELTKMQCIKCNYVFNIGYEECKKEEECPKCKKADLKPYVVFFYEQAPKYILMKREFNRAEDDDIIVIMGTMGNVIDIGRHLDFMYGTKILNNLEESVYINKDKFDYVFYEKGTEAINKIKEIIEIRMKKF
jgi:NAD-dependent deacetylase